MSERGDEGQRRLDMAVLLYDSLKMIGEQYAKANRAQYSVEEAGTGKSRRYNDEANTWREVLCAWIAVAERQQWLPADQGAALVRLSEVWYYMASGEWEDLLDGADGSPTPAEFPHALSAQTLALLSCGKQEIERHGSYACGTGQRRKILQRVNGARSTFCDN